jgi:hypothetical protein
MVFNATFKNISVISWRSVLLVEETRVPRENHQFQILNLKHIQNCIEPINSILLIEASSVERGNC